MFSGNRSSILSPILSICTVEVRKIATVSVIEIKGNAFNPQTLTIPKGTEVIWVNKDSVQHSVESVVWLGNNSIGQPNWDSGTIFKSGVIPPGETFSYTFNQAGTFEYGSLMGYTDKNGLHAQIPNGKVIVT
jgi:plastocyanin